MTGQFARMRCGRKARVSLWHRLPLDMDMYVEREVADPPPCTLTTSSSIFKPKAQISRVCNRSLLYGAETALSLHDRLVCPDARFFPCLLPVSGSFQKARLMFEVQTAIYSPTLGAPSTVGLAKMLSRSSGVLHTAHGRNSKTATPRIP
jgi:hypothetical protein